MVLIVKRLKSRLSLVVTTVVCVAPLAANSLHSSLFRAGLIVASSKVRLCHPGGVESPNWPSPLTLGNCSQNSSGVC